MSYINWFGKAKLYILLGFIEEVIILYTIYIFL